MARLAAEMLDGELIVLPALRPLTTREKLSSLLPRKRQGAACLLICPGPSSLASITLIKNWRTKYNRLVAWVFDSFWTSYVPRFLRSSRVFDHAFVTEPEDLDTWRNMLHAPVEWLPWGSDVLGLGSANPLRHVDLIRLGRQPLEWEDDQSTTSVCESRNLHFSGRPPYFNDASPSDNERTLMEFLKEAKFVLAFNNLASPGKQTHPTREYLTGRWTDAIAAGATVAGIPPRSQSVQSLLWPEALLDVGTVKRDEGLELIGQAVREWTPERARLNYFKSLQRLDWRWRFKKIAAALDVDPPPLGRELVRLKQVIQNLAGGTD